MAYCSHCGKPIENTTRCPHCGHLVVCSIPIYPLSHPVLEVPPQRSFFPALCFALFLGLWGGHRFYTGHTVTGVLQLFTLGGLGAWYIVDIVLILTNNFYDREGRALKGYDVPGAIVILFLFVLITFCWGKTLLGIFWREMPDLRKNDFAVDSYSL